MVRSTRKFLSTFVFVVLMSSVLGACSVRRTSLSDTQSALVGLSCTASPSKQQVNHLESFSVRVNVSGGSGPYSVPGEVSQFASFTDVSRSFDNTTSSDRLVNQTIVVLDADGNGAYCNYVVSVKSISASTSNLACDISSVPAAPNVDQDTVFTLQASGGSNYNFLYFFPDSAQSVTTNALSDGRAVATYRYTAPGARNAFAVVSSGGRLAVCAKQISVGTSALSISALPASVVSVSDTITLTATASGFDATPVYAFSTSEPGVTLSQTTMGGNTATIKVTDGQPHAKFNVGVTASAANGQTSSKTYEVTFAQSMSCTINVPERIVANRTVSITVTSNTNEAMKIEEFSGTDFVNGVGTTAIMAIFPSTGERIIKVRARSLSTGAYCHGGAQAERPIMVVRQLSSCSIQTDANPSVLGNTTRVTAVLPPDAGMGPFNLQLTSNGRYTETAAPNGTQIGIRFEDAGTWVLGMTVTDTSDGSQAVCSTTQTVNSMAGLEARVFRYDKNPVKNEWDNLTSVQRFVAPNINVPTRAWNLGFPGVNNFTEYYVINFRGRLNIPTTGNYRFRTVSDDGVIVYLLNNPIINEPYWHSPYTNTTGNIPLTAGLHDFKVVYQQGPATLIALTFEWLKPDTNIWQIVPPEAFMQPTTPMP